jgi:predicted AAA+ superfamily ATPase
MAESIRRTLELSTEQSFFLFGARGTGKSTLLKQHPHLLKGIYLDFLRPSLEERYSLNPELLLSQATTLKSDQWIIIDEVQRVPKILTVVHKLIEDLKIKFALTGSSSRKLRKSGVDLLAGRAILFNLYPFTHSELGNRFKLIEALQWGLLPKLIELKKAIEKKRFLESYVQVYIKEEIRMEQLVKNLDPFRLFLQMAAQNDGEVINFSNIARQIGVDYKTVQNYYQILCDTNLGQFLEPYNNSVRAVQIQSPKFYFFDNGVKRALDKKLSLDLTPRTSEFRNCFENFMINEFIKINAYLEKDYTFSFLRTKDDAEIDLVIKKPNGDISLVEIKSSDFITESHIKFLRHFEKDFPNAQLICACRVEIPQKIGKIKILPWHQVFKAVGLT